MLGQLRVLVLLQEGKNGLKGSLEGKLISIPVGLMVGGDLVRSQENVFLS